MLTWGEGFAPTPQGTLQKVYWDGRDKNWEGSTPTPNNSHPVITTKPNCHPMA